MSRLFLTEQKKSVFARHAPMTATVVLFLLGGVFFVAVAGAFPERAEAAELLFKPASVDVGPGGEFEISMLLTVDDDAINTIEGSILFPADLLEVREIRDGGSLISFWVARPAQRAITGSASGEISFSGAIPGGWRGREGRLFSVIFTASHEGDARLEYAQARAFLNDGKGTEASLRSSDALVRIAEGVTPKALARANDTDPPEVFTPQIFRETSFYGGAWVLVFSAHDKGSGIDHYEILETTAREKATDSRAWLRGESPYVLRDQERNSVVYVKAIDREGNERLVLVEDETAVSPLRRYIQSAYPRSILFLGVAILCTYGAAFLLRKKQR